MSVKSRLAKMKAKYNDAKKRDRSEGDFEKVPDGMYEMELVEAQVCESKSSGRLQIMWVYEVLEGENAGRKIWDYQGLEQDESLYYVQRHIERLGADSPDDISELEDTLEDLCGTTFRGRVKTKNDFTHVHIQKLLEAAEEGEEEDDVEEEPTPEESEGEEEGEEETVEAEEEVDLEEGMPVVVPQGEGVIVSFPDDEHAKVKVGKKTHKVHFDDIEVDEAP